MQYTPFKERTSFNSNVSEESVFIKIFLVVLAVCLLATAAHAVYAIDAYQRCSIIYFIGEELW